jgi:hypothetical protein
MLEVIRHWNRIMQAVVRSSDHARLTGQIKNSTITTPIMAPMTSERLLPPFDKPANRNRYPAATVPTVPSNRTNSAEDDIANQAHAVA